MTDEKKETTKDRKSVSKLRIIVGGYLGLLPAGGVTWDYVQYPAGFAALGHETYYVEDTRLWPLYVYGKGGSADCSPLTSHLAQVMTDFGLADRWAYRDEASGECFGMSEERVRELCRSADVFVNVSCSTFLRDEYQSIPIRILIDSDPMFTQIQHATQVGFTPGQTGMREVIAGHTHHFTFGENVGQPDCRIPSCGVAWRCTRQPVLLNHWPVTQPPAAGAYTTLMNWTAGHPLTYAGESWGQKDVEFRRFFDMPRRVPECSLGVVVGQTTGVPFPTDEAQQAGWQVFDPKQCASDWRAYQDFLLESRGEFSVAKETYVKARTGWFSCRSACYLAAGRPVVTQDTGWSKHYPTGDGLLTFRDPTEAAEALRRVEANPIRHARAARALAYDFFDSNRVLSNLLQQVGAC
jgi:hypothetical protein